MAQVMINVPIEQENMIRIEKIFGIDLSKSLNEAVNDISTRASILEKAQNLPHPNIFDIYGILEGKYTVSDDFDEPLDDFKDYM
jgi:hypothetical protein